MKQIKTFRDLLGGKIPGTIKVRRMLTGATMWNHHTHCHIDFGTVDRPDGCYVEWDVEREWEGAEDKEY